MRVADLIAASLLLFFGISAAFAGAQLSFGIPAQPGPGFMIVLAGCFLAVLGGMLFLSAIRSTDRSRLGSLWAGLDWKNPAFTGVLLCLYAALLEYAGFLVLTTLLLLVLFTVSDWRRWRFALIASLCATGVTYLVFDRFLGAELPVGQWIERVIAWNS